ncbi:MAG: restriction endonuclease subunit S [Henriciella sp.]|uniref:restriction endonuclease subunit S n=1 Tax=Henriciella sp. TaxID=1968823 RepID=UPI003C71E756
MIPTTDIVANGTPAGWRTVPFWSLFRREKKTGFPNEELLSVYRDYGVIPKASRDDNHNKESEDLSGYQLVTQGALVTNKMKAWQGSIAISRFQGIVSPAYYVYTPQSDECDQFLHYLLRSDPYIGLYGRISKGVRVNQWDLEHEALRNIPVLLPDLATQRQIADFLDRETARIDLLIEKKQRLVALLGEKAKANKLALVTGQRIGEQKQTGILWAPLIPQHWQERAVWMLFELGRGRVMSHEYIAENEGEYPIYSSQTANDGVMGFINTYDFDGDYLTWTTDGAKAGTVFRRSGKFNCTNVCGTLRPLTRSVDLNYAQVALDTATDFFVRHDINPKLMNGVMSKIRIPYPPLDEQSRIGDAIDHIEKSFKPIRDKNRASIDRLKEYRSALITAAVTGQIDVATYAKSGISDRRLDAIQEEMEA